MKTINNSNRYYILFVEYCQQVINVLYKAARYKKHGNKQITEEEWRNLESILQYAEGFHRVFTYAIGVLSKIVEERTTEYDI